jgi:hypothetical protein
MKGAFYDGRFVPADARRLAGELAVLFERGCRLADRLNEASRRLSSANGRLWSGVHPDAVALLYENTDRHAIARGASVIAGVVVDAVRAGAEEFELETEVLLMLQQTHWSIHRAFADYRSVCEERRQLAVSVGELTLRLEDVLTAAGWPADAARRVDVHELAAGAS